MRVTLIAAPILAVSLLRICGTSDAPEKESAAKASAETTAKAAVAAQARIGGNVAAAGDHSIELKLFEHGDLEAAVWSADGKALTGAEAKLAADVAVAGGGRKRVDLAWDAPRARFVGKVDGKLEAKPVDLSLDVSGKTHKATLAEVALLVGPEHGGTLVAAGTYGAEVLVHPDGEVRAFVKDSAGAEVRGEAGVDVDADLKTSLGATENIKLAFDAPRASFVGKAKAKLGAGPLAVRVSGKAGAKAGGLANVALVAQAAHGGRVVVAGDYSVEIVAEPGGLIAAYVFDASGKAVANADFDLKLNIGADAAHAVHLKFDAPSASFKGKLSADLDLAVEPIRVDLRAAGRAFVGAVGSAKANLNARADLKARADANAKLKIKAPTVQAKAGLDKSVSASAKAKIEPPKVNVSASRAASASAGTGASAKAGAKAGFSFGAGTK